MKRITERGELQALARELGVRPDWHEPDEQDVDATVRGISFDNAGFWPEPSKIFEEMHVILWKGNEPVAAVNLATLCAWASEEN